MSEQERPTAGDVEQRTVGAAATDDRRIRGVIPYSTPSADLGGFKEMIEPGAFRNTDISELRALIDHQGVPLGRYPHTLDVEDRSDGLHWALTPPESRRDVVEAVERRDLQAGSWRMVVSKDRWEGDVRHVESISELRDVTLVGASEPAYPAAQVEYRSTTAPKVVSEPPPEAENKEDAVEDRSQNQEGGLHVEDRTVETKRRSLTEEVADFAQDVKKGEVRSLTTAVSLSNPQYSADLFDLLRPNSVFLASGVQTISTDSNSLIYPQVSADPTLSWYLEGGTIAASDPTLVAGTVTPHKLAVRVEYSNELAEDSVPALEGVLRSVLATRGAISVDQAAFQGTGIAPQPTGMGNTASIPTFSAAGLSSGNLSNWAGSAVYTLENNNAERPYAYVGAPNLAKHLRNVRQGAGGTVDAYLFPPTSAELPSLWGASGFVSSALQAGTAYIYAPSACYLVNRTSGFEIEINRARLFDSDRSEMRLRARLDILYPYTGATGAVTKATGVPA